MIFLVFHFDFFDLSFDFSFEIIFMVFFNCFFSLEYVICHFFYFFLIASLRAEGVEGELSPFLGKPSLDIQQVFKGERFGNIVVTMKGTVLATWGTSHVRAKRSEDGGKTWLRYRYRYMTSAADHAPCRIAPLHPRWDHAVFYVRPATN